MLLTRSHAIVLKRERGVSLGAGIVWLQGIGRFFEAPFSTARAGEFVGLSARGCVALLLTRSHAIVLKRERGVSLGAGIVWLQGIRRFFEALFSSARAGEFFCFKCSRVRRFAPYPLARYVSGQSGGGGWRLG
jgi:hypothetical protein